MINTTKMKEMKQKQTNRPCISATIWTNSEYNSDKRHKMIQHWQC